MNFKITFINSLGRTRVFPLLVLLLSLSSCFSDDCSDLIGMPPPFFTEIEFKNAETGEDVYLTGNDIKLKGSNNNKIPTTGTHADTPRSKINFNLGTEHQQAKIYWEFTIHNKPAFTISFNAIETKEESKCNKRHYFYPDRESLKIRDSKGEIIEIQNHNSVIPIYNDL